MRTSLVLCLAAIPMLTPPQHPGDRPTPNPRATRSAVMARNGLIATSQPLAGAAGLKVLQDGGNAIDAAVTAAAVLSVVEPTMNGIGGDLFAIVCDAKSKRLRGLNASGRTGAAMTPAFLASRRLTSIPYRGELAVSVPGVVDGWSELLAKHGTISMARALAPAIAHAREGFAVHEVVAWQWAAETATLARDPAAAKTFLIDGRAPRPGEIFRNPNPAHPNVVAPGKRPFHTLLPAMVMKDGRPWLSFGVMGGDMQPQGHVQVLINLIDFGMNVQEAGEAARFRHTGNGLALEAAISPEARFQLNERGHRLINSIGVFGGFQGILIDPRTGVLMGGSDPRKDGLAIGY